jgi:hypothetical protein
MFILNQCHLDVPQCGVLRKEFVTAFARTITNRRGVAIGPALLRGAS